MSSGLGSLSSFGVGTESTPGTGVTSSVFLPILSESVTANRNPVPSGSIVGDSMVQAVADGVTSVEGGLQAEMEGSVSGQIISYWNGFNGYTHSAITEIISAAPTLVVSAGGTLPDNYYVYYAVAEVLQRSYGDVASIMPRSTMSALASTSSGNNTITGTITYATAPIDGYTETGINIYRASTYGLTQKPAASTAARLATAAALPSCTYANGTSGLGATLTGTSNGALSIDSVVTVAANVVLVKNQVSALQNGLYTVTTVGDAGNPFVLTRHTSMDTTGEFIGTFVVLSAGTVNTGLVFLCDNVTAPSVGTTSISFTQLGATHLQFLKYVAGQPPTFVESAPSAGDPLIAPYQATIYEHAWDGTPPISGDRLPAFTCNVNKNNDHAERYIQCRMDALKFSVGGLGEKMMMDCSLKGVKVESLANFTPTFVPLEPFVGWKAVAEINDTLDCTIESFEIDCSNGVSFVPGLCGVHYNRDVISGKREVSGQFTRQFEDHEFWARMLAGEEFKITYKAYGQSLPGQSGYSTALGGVGNQIDAIPFAYYMTIELFRCKANKAGGNIGGPERIVESVAFMAFKDVTEGTEMRIRLWNATAAYS